MMYCNGMMGGWGWLNALFGLLLLGLIIGGIILVIRRLDTGGAARPVTPAGSAEAILAERYARGEIDEQEYLQRLTVLRGGSTSK